MQPNMRQTVSLLAGQVGYVICGMKTAKVRKLGSFRVKRKFRKPLLGRLYSMLNWTGQPLLRFLVSRFAKISLKDFLSTIQLFISGGKTDRLFGTVPSWSCRLWEFEAGDRKAFPERSCSHHSAWFQCGFGFGVEGRGNSEIVDFLRKLWLPGRFSGHFAHGGVWSEISSGVRRKCHSHTA